MADPSNASEAIASVTSTLADMVSSTAAPGSVITSMATSAMSGLPAITSAATSAVSGLVAVSGTLPNGVLATTVVPYLDPYATVSPPTNGMELIVRVGDHTYNWWSLTTNPFLAGSRDCTIGTCSLILGYTHYFPNAPATLFLLALFAIAFLFNVPVGIWRKTWGYMVGMFFGCGLEVAGYVGRYLYRTDPFSQTNFLINVICLTIGPAFLTASIYLTLARIIMAYGSGNARFKPQIYTITFMVGDFLSLVLQGAGGGIASTADSGSSAQTGGVNTMIAGLSLQVVSLLSFIVLSLDFAWCVRKGRAERNHAFAPLVGSFKWKAFLISLAIATLAIFIRCCYRVAELSKGFNSDFAQEEVTFSILESAMIGVAVIALSVFHPGFIFGKTWADANFSVRGRKPAASSRSSDMSGERVKEGRVGVREV